MSGKKSKKPLRTLAKHLVFGIPTNVAAGPLGFRAELDKGERSCSHRRLRADRADPTVISDEKNPGPSRIVFHKDESEVQGSPLPRTSTAAAILDDEPRNSPTGKRFKYPSSQPISSLTFLYADVLAEAESGFDPLKAILRTISVTNPDRPVRP